MAANLNCEICRKEGVETLIPYDEIGVALMKQHLMSKHNLMWIIVSDEQREVEPDGPYS